MNTDRTSHLVIVITPSCSSHFSRLVQLSLSPALSFSNLINLSVFYSSLSSYLKLPFSLYRKSFSKAQSHFYPLPLPVTPSKQGGGVRGRGKG